MANRSGIRPETLNALHGMRNAGVLDGFYLAGGTGLSLQLHHRLSEDLDFFAFPDTPSEALDVLINRLGGRLPHDARAILQHRGEDQLWFKVGQAQVTFLLYPFALHWPTLEIEGIRVADARDIALQKAYAVGRRLAARDYIDIAYILRANLIEINDLIEMASQTFVIEGERVFSAKLFLQQLAYTGNLRDTDAATALVYDDMTFESISRSLMEAVADMDLSPPEGQQPPETDSPTMR